MHECLLCKRDMKTAKTVFGNGCIKCVYELLDLKMPKKVKDKESYLYNSIMKRLAINSLTPAQKVWLSDRYLTYQYIDKMKYGDYTELKEELNMDMSNIKQINNFSNFITANKVGLKDAYSLYKKEEKFEKYISKFTYAKDTAEVDLKQIWETMPFNLIIKKNTKTFEISAIKSMQYALWQVVAIGGNVVGFDSSSELLEHSLTDEPKDLLITEGEIVEEIKNDSQFKTKLNEIVEEYGKNKLEFNTENGKKLSLQFDNSDLYFSIHKADIKVIGKKENDKWNLEIELIDTYDYSEFKKIKEYIKDANSVPKSMFSSFIYNLAHISSMFGVIKEYKVIVRFTIDDYEVIQ